MPRRENNPELKRNNDNEIFGIIFYLNTHVHKSLQENYLNIQLNRLLHNGGNNYFSFSYSNETYLI